MCLVSCTHIRPCPSRSAETDDTIDAILYDPSKKHASDVVPCFDPATMQLLGHCPAMSEQAVSRDLSGVPDLDPFLSVLAHRLGGGHPIAALQTTSLTAASVLRQGTLHGSPLSGQKPLSCHDHGLLSCMRVLTGTSLLCLS